MGLMDNVFVLHRDLVNYTYHHGGYQVFNICDPKPRRIHKASVRDRLLHHAIYRKLYPFFDRIFIYDSYSCRLNKGTHRAVNRFRNLFYQISQNNTKTCWVLKCDIQKFFASINHSILKNILSEYIPDKKILGLLGEVINSFETKENTGLPLGNLTSQILVNIYMNKFDQFIKHKLKVRYYLRYADDFVLMSDNHDWLAKQIPLIDRFLKNELALKLHPDKIIIKTYASGVDYLGWVSFTDHRILRTTTKRRILKRMALNPRNESINSYFGLIKHGNTNKLKKEILGLIFNPLYYAREKQDSCYFGADGERKDRMGN
ncbi:MAG: Uncharacterized protein CEN92_6 [Candidatus Berkelbacteria bacterium Licking1014_96]|uniref:Reverse transcriptase domain-containing protein n=1 Tax=Candidatus Berkelbacteria bacterium Licking1014_96 TaxID=2017149 RepID=A0A554LHK9_9BACT|nr:MAG: Uncharacterized protein CEN92_6 [Candidatus Berkelbacteria bacterium Licking1014_96]